MKKRSKILIVVALVAMFALSLLMACGVALENSWEVNRVDIIRGDSLLTHRDRGLTDIENISDILGLSAAEVALVESLFDAELRFTGITQNEENSRDNGGVVTGTIVGRSFAAENFAIETEARSGWGRPEEGAERESHIGRISFGEGEDAHILNIGYSATATLFWRASTVSIDVWLGDLRIIVTMQAAE